MLNALLILAAAGGLVAPQATPAGLVELRTAPPHPGQCLSAELRDALSVPAPQDPGIRFNQDAPQPFELFPIAGNLYRDLFAGSFVDLDPSSGALDFECTDYARDGHEGIDVGPRWFAEKRIGVPVFAAQDGVVTVALDGEPDENIAGSLSDLALLLANFGTATGAVHADGDLNCDAAVDLADLALLLSRFGAACP